MGGADSSRGRSVREGSARALCPAAGVKLKHGECDI